MVSKLAPKSVLLEYTPSFTVSVVWRLAVIFILGGALFWAVQQTHTLATIVLLVFLMTLLVGDILRQVERTNREVARVVSALQHGDYSQTFLRTPPDQSFPELTQALENLIAKQRDETTERLADISHLKSLIDHVPIALITIDSQAHVTLLNNAARRLFHRAHGRLISDFAVYGDSVVTSLQHHNGTITLTPNDDASVMLRVTETNITRLGQPQRLLALQPIQALLDANEMALSRGLVRVLTHEIMNSLTPVISLTQSAATLSNMAPPPIDDIRLALQTVARRAEGLMDFVSRYRQLTVAPVIQLAPVSAIKLVTDLSSLFQAQWADIALKLDVAPLDWHINADKHYLEQALINLMKNAAEAALNHHPNHSAIVRVSISPAHGGASLINIEDNGAGIDSTHESDVFLPFFTTKPNGSGIGLSLAKQIIIAHGGSIRVEKSSLGGACIKIVL